MTTMMRFHLATLVALACALSCVPARAQRASFKSSDAKRVAPSGQRAEQPPPLDPFASRARAAAVRARLDESDAGSASPAGSARAASRRRDLARLRDGAALEGAITGVSDATGVVLEIPGESSPLKIPLAEIDALELEVSESFLFALEALESGRRGGSDHELRRALALFQTTRRDSARRLEREWATAKIVETLQALGRYDDAVAEAFLLCRFDSRALFLDALPLQWLNRRSSADPRALEALAYERLAPSSESRGTQRAFERLLAASLLLNSSQYGVAARDALQALVATQGGEDASAEESETLRVVSLLAAAQLQRLELLKGPRDADVERWKRALEFLPNETRSGPTALVGFALERLRRDEDAVAALIRAAATTDDRELARACELAAADALKRLGRLEDERAVRKRAAPRGA